MEQLFSTDTVHPRDRFDYWHDVACRNVLKHDSQPECRVKFQAAIYAGRLADLGLILFNNSPMDVSRTPHQVARATSDELFVCRQMSGLLELEQNGREVAIEAGDVTLIDPLIPYRGRFSRGSNLLVLKVPRRALEARVGGTREMVLRPIKPSQPEGSLLSSFAAMLPPIVGRMSPVAEDLAKEHVLDLLAVSLTTAIGAQHAKDFIRAFACPDECARRDRSAPDRSNAGRWRGGSRRRDQHPLCQRRAGAGGHIDHASHSGETTGALPGSASRPVTGASDVE